MLAGIARIASSMRVGGHPRDRAQSRYICKRAATISNQSEALAPDPVGAYDAIGGGVYRICSGTVISETLSLPKQATQMLTRAAAR